MRIKRCCCCYVLYLRPKIDSKKPCCMEKRIYLPFEEVYAALSFKELNKKFDVKLFNVADNFVARGRTSSNDNKGDKKRSKLRTCKKDCHTIRFKNLNKLYESSRQSSSNRLFTSSEAKVLMVLKILMINGQ